MENTEEFDLNDIIDDQSKYFANIFQLEDDDDENEIKMTFNDSQYYSETEFLNLLQSKKISDLNCLKLFSMNIANILTKLDSLKILIQNLANESNKPNIITVTETHLKANQNHGYSTKDLETLLPGYKFFYENRKIKKGGGVGILIEESLASEAKVESSDLFLDEIFEALTIRIPNVSFEKSKKDLVILSLYRQPGNTNLAKFHELLQSWLNRYDKRTNEIIITGDMNLDLLRYQNHSPTSAYLDLMMSHALLPCITRPTRIAHTSATLIDHIFSKTSIIVSGILACEIAGSSGFTDHYPVFCLLKVQGETQNQNEEVKLSYFTSEGHKMRRDGLKGENWDEFFAQEDPTLAYQILQTKYTTHYSNAQTKKNVKVKKNNCPREPWMTSEILKKMRKRDRIVKLNGRRNDYKKLRNEIVNDCRKAEKNYYKTKIAESWNDIKGHWDILRKVMGKTNNKNELPKAFKVNDAWITDKQNIADSFNSYYARVGPDTNESVGQSKKTTDYYQDKNQNRNTEEISTTVFSEDEIIDACKMLNPKKSYDAYGFSQKIVLQDIDVLAPMFTHLANCSLATGSCPDQSKIARVIPVYKNKGETYLFSNYRPISLIPVFSKIIEKLMYNKIFHFLVRQKTLFKSQYGFRRGRNTTHATLDFLQTIEEAMRDNEIAIGVFVDLSKAFDTLDHNILLSKLDHYGIRGNLLSWLKSYLSNRKQFVDVYGIRSKEEDITVGVPQGSILGPLLFLIYINDLPAALCKLIPVMFADDTNLIVKGKNIDELVKTLNAELECLSDYFKANKLKLNTDKTKIVCFRKKGKVVSTNELEIVFDGKKLVCEKNTTFLGIILDEHLTWEDHCNAVANKMARNAGVLNRVKNSLPSPSLQTLYNSLIFSHYSYGLEAWGVTKQKNLKRILGIQKKALRSVTKSHWLAHSEPRMKQLGILKVTDQYLVQCINTTHDMLMGNCPDIFNLCEQQRSVTATRNLRSTSSHPLNLNLPPTNSIRNGSSFPLLAPTYWNSLPDEIKNEQNRNRFKKLNKKRIIESYNSYTNCNNPLCMDSKHHHPPP